MEEVDDRIGQLLPIDDHSPIVRMKAEDPTCHDEAPLFLCLAWLHPGRLQFCCFRQQIFSQSPPGKRRLCHCASIDAFCSLNLIELWSWADLVYMLWRVLIFSGVLSVYGGNETPGSCINFPKVKKQSKVLLLLLFFVHQPLPPWTCHHLLQLRAFSCSHRLSLQFPLIYPME